MSDEVNSINKKEKQTAEYEYKELPEGWWHELDWILPGREKEPTRNGQTRPCEGSLHERAFRRSRRRSVRRDEPEG